MQNAVNWIFFVSLVLVAIFFLHDVRQNYQKGATLATSIQVTSKIINCTELGSATGAMAPLVFLSQKVSKTHSFVGFFKV